MDITKSEYFFLLYLTKTKFNKGMILKPKFGSYHDIETDLMINFPTFSVSQRTLTAYIKKYLELKIIQREYIESTKQDRPINGYTVNKSELIKFIKKTDIYVHTMGLIKENGLVLD